jgi:hypothetical protein
VRPTKTPPEADWAALVGKLIAVAGMGAIMQAIGTGDLGAREAGELAGVVAGFSQTITTAQLEQRLGDIEKAIALLKRG